MFSEEQLRAYRKVTAPDALYERVMEQERALPQKNRGLQRLAALAACLVLILSAVILLTRENSVSVVLWGEEIEESHSFAVLTPASEMRTAPAITVPLEILPQGETVIRVSRGSLHRGDGESFTELTVTEKAVLEWIFPNEAKSFTCQMELVNRNGCVQVHLSYDAETQRITATKTEKN